MRPAPILVASLATLLGLLNADPAIAQAVTQEVSFPAGSTSTTITDVIVGPYSA